MVKQRRLIHSMIYILLLAGSFIMLGPLVWTLSTSLKSQQHVFDIPPQWIPDPLTWLNYKDVWAKAPLLYGFMNSAIVVVTVLTIGLFVAAMAAYAFSKFDFPFKEGIFMALLGTMMIPYSVVMIPQYIGFSELGWVDTLLPLIVPGLFGNIVTIFFFRQFMQGSIPTDLIDAAKIDGCGYFRTFTTVALPIVKPAIAAQAALGFMGIWNDFMGPLIYLHTPERQTIQVLIASMQSNYISTSNYPSLMAASIVALLPVVIVFFMAQRYFIESLAITGIKG
ncbi:binding-protein-dependent transport systems inner membrane component [Paenibacillus vortex V453]|jgi:multiple sugar transport system permease protein|uniref:Sugar ABC transporter permease n=2 Tax=Paenibacillus TaxID=44249 RepID=A0A163D880_9BACL|nr:MULTISPECIES: carbohydrate ABC transporter permease [Paenibacillus]ANA82793.1 sugar ABC transporter permease [Paenibacillus glucanolyticus]AVV58123.1 carbohydrate ABC transporter permease [Paenibacillus glucanolyticus]AWP27286.1 sugar ABC transporter permease [Paenibacillus sp. Cedars]EFU39707.1 binding-protein-dependent transport systems inner membrane component [Paenibacillus vortex V453]ETT42871.1 binding-protein-dependent transport system inner membrane protein [Paenibacillus sp. FSL R5